MRLGFACPYYGYTPPRVVVSQHAAVMHVAWQHPWVATCTTSQSAHIAACEKILERALAHKELDALFWTEHDCILPIDSVTRLVKILEEHPEADAATGITFMRYKPFHPMIANFAGILTQEMYDQLGRSMISVVPQAPGESPVGKPHYRFVTHIDTSAKPYEVTATSMNCLLLRRRTLELMATIPHVFDTDNCSTPDFALFDRLKDHGTRLFVDPALLTLHLEAEPRAIGVDDWIEAMEDMIARGEAERLPDDAPSGESPMIELPKTPVTTVRDIRLPSPKRSARAAPRRKVSPRKRGRAA